MKKFPELLCPAGDKEKFFTAITYGADAVYLGGSELSLRAKTKGFSLQELPKIIKFAHQHKTKVYFCLNILAQEKHLSQIQRYLEALAQVKPDALIIADPGVISLAQKYATNIPIHLSTQANTSNSLSALFWQKQGIKRINLARELNFKQIKEIQNKIKNSLEIEVFVHGAMCMAISGRCFLSSYLNQRSANLGLCTHPCRFEYQYFLKEQTRKENIFEVFETNEYSKILASEDLCLLKYLAWFVKNNIASLKIEGRNKTISYLAIVVNVYRTALDNLLAHKFDYNFYLKELQNTFTRPVGTGFFLGKPKILYTPYSKPKKTLAWIEQQKSFDKWKIKVKHRWETNKKIKIKLPGLQNIYLPSTEYMLENKVGEKVKIAHPGLDYYLRLNLPQVKPYLIIQE
ncbi:putative protease [Desulfonauticus submarinus]|uniref:Putative protease n=1 Tax=Desulfonauticus submarinus TaxID=206665 RepID=A0A1H0EZ58_9BACT|nr:peptidase U32 family protein [Desulfonauticus submarinus]SDN87586.1 putative protease [Desulfonauticus submarinus]